MCLVTEWPDTWNHKTSKNCLLHLEVHPRKERGRMKCKSNWTLICLPGNSDSSLLFVYSCKESSKWTSYPTVTRQIWTNRWLWSKIFQTKRLFLQVLLNFQSILSGKSSLRFLKILIIFSQIFEIFNSNDFRKHLNFKTAKHCAYLLIKYLGSRKENDFLCEHS